MTFYPYLDTQTNFKWGGRTWTSADEKAFAKKLGPKKYAQWKRQHARAATTFDPVAQQIAGMFQPQISALDYERKQRQDYYARLGKDLTGFTAALMPYLQQVGPKVAGEYGLGADTMSGLGAGYGAVENRLGAEDAARANATLNAIGAPEGQKINSGDPGGVLAGLAGWLPADMLKTQGGAYGYALGQLPKTASLESQLMMKELLTNAKKEDQDFSQKIMEVLQGLPAAKAQLSAQQKADKLAASKEATRTRLADAKFALDQLKSERDWYLKQQYLAEAAGDDARANKYLKLAQDAEDRRRKAQQGYDTEGNLLPGYVKDPKTGLPIPRGKPGSKGGKGTNYYAKGRTEIGDAQKDVDSFIEKNYIKEVESDPVTGAPLPVPRKVYGDWNKVIAETFDRFKYLIPAETKPMLRKKLEAMLKKAIIASMKRQGFKKPLGPSGLGIKDVPPKP